METTPRVTFRSAIEDDLDKMVEIENECFSDAWSRDAFRSCLAGPFYEVVVAFVDDEIIGYGIMKCLYEDGELVRIAVTSKCHRRKVAYRILDWLIKIATHEGVENVFLDVRESNEPAIKLYEKMGFEKYEITEGFYNDPKEASIKMKKETKGN